MRIPFLLASLVCAIQLQAQSKASIQLEKEYLHVPVSKSQGLDYELKLTKGSVYHFAVQQEGIDVVVELSRDGSTEKFSFDSPTGKNGLEKFDIDATQSGKYSMVVRRLDEAGNSDSGKVSVIIKKLSKDDAVLYRATKKELEVENKKNVQTLDIDHFWDAFDRLKLCKSRADSLTTIQKYYLDRATSGLIDFTYVREFTAAKFVDAIAAHPKFYNSIRANTYETKKAAPLIDEVFNKFSSIYPNFKPFKVCFAIGYLNTGGTVSGKFVLIGSEVTTSTADNDLSEFNNNAFSKSLAGEKDIVQKIKNIVAHECVHTQQKQALAPGAFDCPVLTYIMAEGFCDFIGEMVSGGQINKNNHDYGNKHEKELWYQLKGEMCSENTEQWLYNYSTVKDKPADLGYYMGYKIAEEYYKNASDKKKAIIDIIEVDDPMKFLEISRYDVKKKN